jgi:hypothetical protein
LDISPRALARDIPNYVPSDLKPKTYRFAAQMEEQNCEKISSRAIGTVSDADLRPDIFRIHNELYFNISVSQRLGAKTHRNQARLILSLHWRNLGKPPIELTPISCGVSPQKGATG